MFSLKGETWHSYASETLYREVDHIKYFVPSDFVYNQALELWLELRKEINLTVAEKDSSENLFGMQENNKNFMEKKFEESNIYEIFEIKFSEKCIVTMLISIK